MTEKRFTKQEVYDGINRYKINESNFIVEILDDGIPMHYSTIVNRLNEQHKTITRLEKENGGLRFANKKKKRENKKLKNEKLSLERENEKLNGRVHVITREYMDWKFSARKFQKKYQSAVKLLMVIKHELMTLNNLRLVDSNNDLVYVNFNDLLEKIEEVMK